MMSLDDEFLNEDAKKAAIRLRKTTANLVRYFMNPMMYAKIRSIYEAKTNEYTGLVEAFDQIKGLWWTKLTTPLEEQLSIREQLKLVKGRVQKM